MAGESPDRSKQGEAASSASTASVTSTATEETTSRHAGPVPAVVPDGPARGRDPRVAVALVSEDEENEDSPDADVEEPENLGEDSGDSTEDAPEGAHGDTQERTRNGSNADVSAERGNAVDKDKATGKGKTTDGDKAVDGDDTSGGDQAADEGALARGSGSADVAEPADGGKAAGEGEPAGDARLRNAVAAWVARANDSGADVGASESSKSSDSSGASGASGAGDASDSEGAEDAERGVSEAAPKNSGPTGEGSAEEEPTDAESTDAESTDAASAEDAEEDDEEAEPEPASSVRVEDEPKPAPAKSESGSAKSDSAPAKSESAKSDSVKPDSAKSGPASAPSKASDASESAKDSAKDSGPAKAPKASATPPVDQPTTAIRTVRRPQADQPTTMLKVGGVVRHDTPVPEKKVSRPASKPEALSPGAPSTGKPTPDALNKPKAPAAPADRPKAPADAERTSQFVALKPLPDEVRSPSAPGGARPADATTAFPRVGPERTTQVPLPPKPPLDLLAELTNTPPPPETWWRVALRRIKIYTPLVILLAIVFVIVQVVRPLPQPTLTLTAADSHTFAGDQVHLPWPDEGQGWMDVNGLGTMDHFGQQTPVPIGSVAKSMTAYVVLKDHPLKPGEEGPKIPVDATAEKEGHLDTTDNESTLNTIKAGDQLTLRQALSAIMIPSANNVARLVARWDAGSQEAFVKKMNDTAKALGMNHTTYTDPSGLTETTVSTAEDQVKLGNQLVDIPALMAITKLPTWKDPSGHTWTNYNRLVPFDGGIGIKTGTTTKAGGNLLFAATKDVDGEQAIVVGAILGQHKGTSILDTVNAVSKTAMLAARDALTSEKIIKKGDVVGYVDDQLGGRTPVVVSKDVEAIGWSGHTVKLSFKPDDLPHKAPAGTRVGTLTVGDGTKGAVEVPVQLRTDLTEPGFGAKLTNF